MKIKYEDIIEAINYLQDELEDNRTFINLSVNPKKLLKNLLDVKFQTNQFLKLLITCWIPNEGKDQKKIL